MKLRFTLLALLLLPFLGQSQIILFKGKVIDAVTTQPLEGVSVQTDLATVFTDVNGEFEIELAMDVQEVPFILTREGYTTYQRVVIVENFDVQDLGVIKLSAASGGSEQLAREDQIPSIIVTASDLDDADQGQDISGLLTASRDPFISAAAFNFGPARFRIRGYDSEYTNVFMNGVPVNRLENGRVFWAAWGGLNDVMRNRENDIGLDAMNYSIGGVGGGTSIDTRASNQWAQTRVSYASSNRTYRNRVMVTHSSGLQSNGWAYSLSASRRWGNEGYIEGTSYDAWSYFLSIDKVLNEQHALNLTVFGAPNRRGRPAGVIQELYDLTGSNYYNPNWGWYEGEKRNAREAHTHQPMFILRHDWTIGENASLTTAASYQFGENGSTALDWFDARDPRPNYYRYLPTWYNATENPLEDQVAEAYANDEFVSQLDWYSMYEANENSSETIENVDGIEGNDVTGKLARYIIEDRRFDSREFNFNTIYEQYLNDNITVHGGLGYQVYVGDYFKEVEDLLGADFYIDINRFAQFNSVGDETFIQNDISRPNRLLEEGDRFGYDYSPNIRKGFAWAQTEFSYNKIDFFVGGEVSNTRFWRDGKVANGQFPDNSLGESERQNFWNYKAKAGFTYKVNNKNYLYANGAIMNQAPYLRNSFVSPRTRNDVAPGLTSEDILSGEIGYILRSTRVKARATAYYTRFTGGNRTISFFNDEEIRLEDPAADTVQTVQALGFVNYTLTGIDREHRGAELAVEWKVTPSLTVTGVAALGQYLYSSSFAATIVNDVDPTIGVSDREIFLENYRLPGRPHTAYTAGLSYRGKKFWFANLNFNYFDNIYMDVNPNRRTIVAASNFQEGVTQRNDILLQEQVSANYTLDFFGGKSFKFGDLFMYINVGVSNILDNQEFITGGYEQLRFEFETQDPGVFPSRYFYLFGRNYFASLTFRL